MSGLALGVSGLVDGEIALSTGACTSAGETVVEGAGPLLLVLATLFAGLFIALGAMTRASSRGVAASVAGVTAISAVALVLATFAGVEGFDSWTLDIGTGRATDPEGVP